MTPSDNLMRRLARVNPTTAFIAALAAMLAGLFLPGILGGALLFLLAAGPGRADLHDLAGAERRPPAPSGWCCSFSCSPRSSAKVL